MMIVCSIVTRPLHERCVSYCLKTNEQGTVSHNQPLLHELLLLAGHRDTCDGNRRLEHVSLAPWLVDYFQTDVHPERGAYILN